MYWLVCYELNTSLCFAQHAWVCVICSLRMWNTKWTYLQPDNRWLLDSVQLPRYAIAQLRNTFSTEWQRRLHQGRFWPSWVHPAVGRQPCWTYWVGGSKRKSQATSLTMGNHTVLYSREGQVMYIFINHYTIVISYTWQKFHRCCLFSEVIDLK